MLIFLDTEYTDALNCDLISIGMVSEDGLNEIYLERSDYNIDWCSSFVHDAVRPQLGKTGQSVGREMITELLNLWFRTLPTEITIACDNFTDWELLVDALNGDLPENILGMYDLRKDTGVAEFGHALVRYHEVNGGWHHALHDAKALRQGWIANIQRKIEFDLSEKI